MISWFEKHSKTSYTITLLIAIIIYYMSSLTFKPTGIIKTNLYSIFYHLIIFFAFNFFLLISLIKGKKQNLMILMFIATLISISYGISDEIHQFFVIGRCCSISDALIDSVGILFSIMIYAIRIKLKN